ncbi:MAG: hypothetical protein MUC49_00690 [Raineya sp.]|jgi:hypothetical protein|nr:hypothetical protein [Raineya sp.]
MPELYKDQGIWNEFHGKNIGNIIFSTEKIFADSPNAALERKSFGLNEFIRGRVYLDKSVLNTYKMLENSGVYPPNTWYATDIVLLGYKIFINDEEKAVFSVNFARTPSAETWTTFYYDFVHMDKMTYWDSPHQYKDVDYYFNTILRDLAPDEYSVRIECFLPSPDGSFQSESIAKGSFTLKFNKEDKDNWVHTFGANHYEYLVHSSKENEEEKNETIQPNYLTVINWSGQRIDIEICEKGQSYGKTDFINDNARSEYLMNVGDVIRLKESRTIIYTHTAYNREFIVK